MILYPRVYQKFNVQITGSFLDFTLAYLDLIVSAKKMLFRCFCLVLTDLLFVLQVA